MGTGSPVMGAKSGSLDADPAAQKMLKVAQSQKTQASSKG